MNNKQTTRQRGAAMIIVLGLVALISTWAIDALYADNIALRRAENTDNALRAELASQSALILASKILIDDQAESQNDDLDEIWAQQATPFPIDNGLVQASIIDANRFLNLNDLVDKNGKANIVFEKYVKRLFIQLDLNEGLVDALIDWMDRDGQVHGSAGAEDASYSNQDYHIKNARLDSWDELLLVRGFDAKIMARLSTAASVHNVPPNGITRININTATAATLMALAADMSLSDAEILISERPFESVQQALQNRPWLANMNQAYLSVASDVFMVRTQASFGRANLRELSMLQRQSNKITMLSLQRSHDSDHFQVSRKSAAINGN
ncbi:MAG: type II secretion system minor pseudopilin GspK [Mariprofundus sp.]|nr:type II secretion system minor pseudopilin GspK [Mariprofundus sp.]